MTRLTGFGVLTKLGYSDDERIRGCDSPVAFKLSPNGTWNLKGDWFREGDFFYPSGKGRRPLSA